VLSAGSVEALLIVQLVPSLELGFMSSTLKGPKRRTSMFAQTAKNTLYVVVTLRTTTTYRRWPGECSRFLSPVNHFLHLVQTIDFPTG
jgi:hypothetical protein